MGLLKVWIPIITTALATLAGSFSEPVQQFILDFAAQRMDITIGLVGLYALIANLLPSPAKFQALIDEFKAKAKAEATAELKSELKEEVKAEVEAETQG